MKLCIRFQQQWRFTEQPPGRPTCDYLIIYPVVTSSRFVLETFSINWASILYGWTNLTITYESWQPDSVAAISSVQNIIHVVMMWLLWRSVHSGVVHMNKVKIRQARLVQGLATTFDGVRSLYFQGHLGPLSLAVFRWATAMSTGDGFGHHWGRNGEFCVLVCPETRLLILTGHLAEMGCLLWA